MKERKKYIYQNFYILYNPFVTNRWLKKKIFILHPLFTDILQRNPSISAIILNKSLNPHILLSVKHYPWILKKRIFFLFFTNQFRRKERKNPKILRLHPKKETSFSGLFFIHLFLDNKSYKPYFSFNILSNKSYFFVNILSNKSYFSSSFYPPNPFFLRYFIH